MTDITVSSQPEISGRSLAQLAMMRFRRNKAAISGCVLLAFVTLFSFAGPLFVPHSYDQVFSSYVNVPPSLTPAAGSRDAAGRGRKRGPAG